MKIYADKPQFLLQGTSITRMRRGLIYQSPQLQIAARRTTSDLASGEEAPETTKGRRPHQDTCTTHEVIAHRVMLHTVALLAAAAKATSVALDHTRRQGHQWDRLRLVEASNQFLTQPYIWWTKRLCLQVQPWLNSNLASQDLEATMKAI